MSSSESELWERFKKGDYKAFKKIYDQFFDELLAYGLKISGSTVKVEDAIHDLFLDLWKYRSKLSATTSIKFYLYKSLKRKLFKNNKKGIFLEYASPSTKNVIKQLQEKEADSVEMGIANTNREKLIGALKNLPHRQYEALVLRFYAGFDYGEIGELLGVNSQSARNLVQRGLKKLSKIFAFVLYFTQVAILNVFT